MDRSRSGRTGDLWLASSRPGVRIQLDAKSTLARLRTPPRRLTLEDLGASSERGVALLPSRYASPWQALTSERGAPNMITDEQETEYDRPGCLPSSPDAGDGIQLGRELDGNRVGAVAYRTASRHSFFLPEFTCGRLSFLEVLCWGIACIVALAHTTRTPAN